MRLISGRLIKAEKSLKTIISLLSYNLYSVALASPSKCLKTKVSTKDHKIFFEGTELQLSDRTKMNDP